MKKTKFFCLIKFQREGLRSCLKLNWKFFFLILIQFITSFLLIFLILAFQLPRIVEHPSDTTVPKNEPLTMNCVAEGSPDPTISWFKDGAQLKVLPHRLFLPQGGLFFLKVFINFHKFHLQLYLRLDEEDEEKNLYNVFITLKGREIWTT